MRNFRAEIALDTFHAEIAFIQNPVSLSLNRTCYRSVASEAEILKESGRRWSSRVTMNLMWTVKLCGLAFN